MNEAQDFLRNLAMVLGVAAITSVVCQRLRLPVVFGYMLAGLIIGPHIPIPLVADPEMIRTLSELGVVLLMFSIGLEFTFERIARVGPSAGAVGVLETSVMAWLGFTAARLLGWSFHESVTVGAAVAISSTTIIAKAFRERNVAGSFTTLVFGVLLVEDLIAVVLLTVLTAVTAGHALSAAELGVTIGRLGAFLVGLLVAGMLLVPRFVRFVVRLGRPETTLVVAVGLCFGVALLARSFGYSVALGAFLAGSLVAESGEQRTIERLIEPVRDMFAAIFFVAIGMQIDPAQVARHWPAVLLFTLLVVLGKVSAVSVSAFLAGHGTRTAVQAGMSLAQIGEFSLIIAGIGLASGATREFIFPVTVAVSAITTLLTPWLIQAADPVAAAIDRRLPRPLQTFVALYGSWIENLKRPETSPEAAWMRRALRTLLIDAAVIAALSIGAAVEGPRLTRWLASVTGWPWLHAGAVVAAGAVVLSLPFVIGMLRTARALGQALARRAFPDPAEGRLDLAAAPRRALVVTLQLAMVLVIGMPLVAVTQPFVPGPIGAALLIAGLVVLGVAFWRNASDLQGHVRAGAEAIVEALGRQARQAPRGETLAASPDSDVRALERAYEVLPGLGAPVPVRLAPESPVVGQQLSDLRLRGRTGATILAISRGQEMVLMPDGHVRLEGGDVVALAGTREAIEAARRVLTERPPVDRAPPPR